MKKYIAALAAVAVLGGAGVFYVNEKMDDTSVDTETTTSATSSYSQSADSDESDSVAVNNDVTEENTTEKEKKEYSFTAEIDSVKGGSLMLLVKEGEEILKSGDKVSVGVKDVEVVDSKGQKIKTDDIGNFETATVTYDGSVMETYPLQVDALKITLKNRTDCNVYFCLEDGEVIDTLTVEKGSSLESADMPNAGAYCSEGYHFEGWTLDGETVYGLEKVDDSVSLIAKIRKD